jgi:RsiW-degrading membrane proteinase PrsW (M82 family)
MFPRLLLTFAATLPFYLGTIWVVSHSFHTQFKKMVSLFALSTLSTIPLFILAGLGIDKAVLSSVFGPLYSVILLAFMEETFKSLIWFFPKLEKLPKYSKAIAIGLGFAFFENIHYLWDLDFTPAFVLIALFRLLIDSTAHSVFAGIFGAILERGKKKAKTFYYFLALFTSGSAHAIFNLLHHWELSYLTVPFLIVLIYALHEEEEWFPDYAVKIPHHKARSKIRNRGLSP